MLVKKEQIVLIFFLCVQSGKYAFTLKNHTKIVSRKLMSFHFKHNYENYNYHLFGKVTP